MAAEESPGQQGLSPQRHRELFGRFCRQKFHDGGRGCSKTVSSKKRDRIVRYLSNKLEADAVSPHFRFWVKTRGFQLVEMDGAQVLCLPNKQRVESDPESVGWKRVVSVEEFFDVIATHHLVEDGCHLGIKKTLSKIVKKYECMTRTAVEGYMELCSGCRGRARKRGGRGLAVTPPTGRLRDSNPISFMASTQVDLMDMSPNMDGQYQWLGHFSDHWSCFHVLFPLTSVSATELALNLCRHVFAVFGFPQVLHCNLGRQFTAQVVTSLSHHWQGDVETQVMTTRLHNPALDTATAKLEELIAEYLPRRPRWTQWLPFVQYTLNTEPTSKQVKTGFSKSPLNILFPCLTSWKTGEGEEEEEEEGEEEGESEEGEEEEVQLEIISDSITQGTTPEVWQMNVNPIPPVTSGPPTSQSTSTPNVVLPSAAPSEDGMKEKEEERRGEGEGGGGGGAGGGEDTSVQQILMPPDADFLSTFYEAAQAGLEFYIVISTT
ncbi:KRAB-A domain-containing protein 2 [Geodia barretti]|uniref:KRAB-A domain-containing protein 2 n=1 Tax=Geodia barretti TaxID=519541 RepID=A0AA35RKE2_GEOBA|nr:KRAB-A domain-containing protein 2 [Geodia barretti]